MAFELPGEREGILIRESPMRGIGKEQVGTMSGEVGRRDKTSESSTSCYSWP